MRRIVIAPVFALSIVLLGCSEGPEIAGRVVVRHHDETLVLQTGDGGREWSDEGDKLVADCTTHESLFMVFEDYRKYKARSGLWIIYMRAENDLNELLPEIWNVNVEIDDGAYRNLCPVVYTKIADDPYEAEISTSDCELYPHRSNRDLTKPYLESASFHVKSCGSEPLF